MNGQSIVISVHPQHVRKILSGEKKYEFRRVIPKREVKKIVIYATSPERRVLAVADVENILDGVPGKIWHRIRKDSGVTREFFDAYFHQRQIAFAIKLTNVREIAGGARLKDLGSSITPPQSFMYLSDSHIKNIEAYITRRP